MAIRFISKGKGRKRKSFPIRPKKKGVSVRSVSLQPSAVVKINKQQIKLLNKGEPATFSKALNQVIIRAKRDGIPIYDTHVNSNDRRKPYMMWIVKDPKGHAKVKGSETIVMAEHYGQAIDDFITTWNKEKRKKITIGYPQVQGTAEKSFRYKRDPSFTTEFPLPKTMRKAIVEGLNTTDFVILDQNKRWKLTQIVIDDGSEFFVFPDEDSALAFGRQSIRDTASEYIPDEGSPQRDEYINLSDDDLVDKIIDIQSDFGQRSELGAIAQSVASYDGQFSRFEDGSIAFQIS